MRASKGLCCTTKAKLKGCPALPGSQLLCWLSTTHYWIHHESSGLFPGACVMCQLLSLSMPLTTYFKIISRETVSETAKGIKKMQITYNSSTKHSMLIYFLAFVEWWYLYWNFGPFSPFYALAWLFYTLCEIIMLNGFTIHLTWLRMWLAISSMSKYLI